MPGIIFFIVSASVVYLFSAGVSDAFVPSASPLQLPSTSTAQGAAGRQELQRETLSRVYASLGPTKPSLKPSWKSPRLKSPTQEDSVTKTRDPLEERTESATIPTTNTARESYRAFEKPNWRTPKATTTSSPYPPSAPTTTVTEPAASSVTSSTTPPSSPDGLVQNMPTMSAGASVESVPSAKGGVFSSPIFERSLEEVRETVIPLTKAIRENMAQGTIGERGEEWALGQGIILLCIALGTVPVLGNMLMFLAGPVFVVSGVALGGAGVVSLGKNLSPWPVPVDDNQLRTSGVFGLVRHPTYAGVLLFTFGFGVVTESPFRMLLAVALAILLDKKTLLEEDLLVAKHGKNYQEYRSRVAKFIPWLY